MHLCNGAGTKPLKKLFQERGVPPGKREQQALLRDDLGIVWLEGFGCAHRCRITASTRRVLVVRVREGAPEG
jgi:tRNA(Ile)-lysidine synthetase-like protein